MANVVKKDQVSTYLEHLPAIFQQDAGESGVSFIGRFLLAFEEILGGLGRTDVKDDQKGLEEKIDQIHTYFDPDNTPSEFLPWLAGWVALRLRDDWGENDRRQIMGEIVSMYRKRGTLEGLQWALETFTKANLKWTPNLEAEIDELNTPFQIGIHSTIGKDSRLDGGPPNFFKVRVPLKTRNPQKVRQHYEVITSIIDAEKPVHTYYELELMTLTLQIGVHSRIGEDTQLGTIKE